MGNIEKPKRSTFESVFQRSCRVLDGAMVISILGAVAVLSHWIVGCDVLGKRQSIVAQQDGGRNTYENRVGPTVLTGSEFRSDQTTNTTTENKNVTGDSVSLQTSIWVLALGQVCSTLVTILVVRNYRYCREKDKYEAIRKEKLEDVRAKLRAAQAARNAPPIDNAGASC